MLKTSITPPYISLLSRQSITFIVMLGDLIRRRRYSLPARSIQQQYFTSFSNKADAILNSTIIDTSRYFPILPLTQLECFCSHNFCSFAQPEVLETSTRLTLGQLELLLSQSSIRTAILPHTQLGHFHRQIPCTFPLHDQNTSAAQHDQLHSVSR